MPCYVIFNITWHTRHISLRILGSCSYHICIHRFSPALCSSCSLCSGSLSADAAVSKALPCVCPCRITSEKSEAARFRLYPSLSSASHIRCHCCCMTALASILRPSMVAAHRMPSFFVLNTLTRWMRVRSVSFTPQLNRSTFRSGFVSARV